MSAKGGKTTDRKAIAVGGNAKLSMHCNKSILAFFSCENLTEAKTIFCRVKSDQLKLEV